MSGSAQCHNKEQGYHVVISILKPPQLRTVVVEEAMACNYFRHLSEWQIIICKTCHYAVWPSQVEGHLRNKQHGIPKRQASAISDEVHQWPDPEAAAKVFEEIERLQSPCESSTRLRLHPCQEEFEASATKVDDVEVLDEVARLSSVDTLRSRTCYSSSHCQVTGGSVLKRTHCSGGQHVRVRPRPADMKRLSCHGGGDSFPYWFHQEHLECFERNGEYRVIIAIRRNPGRLRGQEAYVVEIFKTFFARSPLHAFLVAASFAQFRLWRP